MLKKEYQILAGFTKTPWKKVTFKEAKTLSRKKSESYVYNALKKFVGQGVLRKENAGNVVLYSLNLASLKTHVYAGFVAEYLAWGTKRIPHKDLEGIAAKIPTSFYILIIAGSYAKGTQKKGSDIDAVIICDEGTDPKKVYAELRHECEMNIPSVHLYVFKKSEFLAMLLDEKSNYGKEVAKANLLLFGGQEYYNIMSEAIHNGFNG